VADLGAVPIWLFSSGPLGDSGHLIPEGEPAEVAELTELTGALGHCVLAGRLYRAKLGVLERATVRAVSRARRFAKDEVSLDPISDLVGRFSGLHADWDEAVAELAERRGRRGCELATEAGLLARPLAASGKPAPTILRTTDEHDACAIVLGSGAHNRLGSPFGSVVARVVRGANRPVLVVPAAKQPRSEPAGA
jgi:nucleotide-binding universal stress UspA family protein